MPVQRVIAPVCVGPGRERERDGGGEGRGGREEGKKQLRPHFHAGMPDEAAVIFWRGNTSPFFRRCTNAEVAYQ